jgi:hypothetical protein
MPTQSADSASQRNPSTPGLRFSRLAPGLRRISELLADLTRFGFAWLAFYINRA